MPHTKKHEELIVDYAMAAPGEKDANIDELVGEIASCEGCLSFARQTAEDLPFIVMALGEGEIWADLQICESIERRMKLLLERADGRDSTADEAKTHAEAPSEPLAEAAAPAGAVLETPLETPCHAPHDHEPAENNRAVWTQAILVAVVATLLLGLLFFISPKNPSGTGAKNSPANSAAE